MPRFRAIRASGLLALLVLMIGACGVSLAPGALAQSSDAARMASMQAHILQLEEEIRRLTGRIEQMEFENRQVSERMDRLVADLDNRLRALDQREQASTVPSADGNAAIQAEPPVAAPAASADVVPTVAGAADTASDDSLPVIGSDGGAGAVAAGAAGAAAASATASATANEGGQVLGTIPRNALLDLPRPSEEALAAAAASLPKAALEGDEESRYEAAISLLRAGSIDAAEVAFRRFVEDFPESGHAPEASYWIGETLLARGDPANAAATFARNIRSYGFEARKAQDNILKLGVALNTLGDSQKACASFAELEKRYGDLSVPMRQVLARERTAAGCS